MKVKHSPLKWKHFALLQFDFKFISPEEQIDINPQDYFVKYSIEADFAIKEHQQDVIQVFFKTEINGGQNPLLGYTIFAEATGIFTIENTDQIPEENLRNLKGYSTVNLLINRLRHSIRLLTAESAFGAYEYPPLDITNLFEQKQQA